MTEKHSEEYQVLSLPERLNLFIQKNARVLLIGLMLCLGIFLLLNKVSRMQRHAAEQSFLETHELVTRYSQTKDNEDLIYRIQESLEEYPELSTRYGGQLLQTMLLRGKNQKLLPLMESSLARTKEIQHERFQQFTQTTLLIAGEKHKEALSSAIELKTALEAEEELEYLDFLKAYNLLRIASLYHTLDMPQKELDAWNAIEEEAQWNTEKTNPAYHKLSLCFQEGKVDLPTFIQARKKEITSLSH